MLFLLLWELLGVGAEGEGGVEIHNLCECVQRVGEHSVFHMHICMHLGLCGGGRGRGGVHLHPLGGWS